MKLFAAAAASVLLLGCVQTETTPAPVAPPAGAATGVVAAPFADHHTHIWSLSVASHRIKPPLPPIQLPPGVAHLLLQRQQLPGGRDAFRDRAALAGIYADDAVVVHRDWNNWVRGPVDASIQASLQATLRFNGRRPRLTPVGFAAGESVGYVAGYFTEGEGSSARHVGEFHLSLKKSPSSSWVIAAETNVFPGPTPASEVAADMLVKQLDEAGVRKALVLASSYWWGSSIQDRADDEHAKVRAENEWVARQVARFPDRLVGFCAVNPLRDYALAEIKRCATGRQLRGLKLHIADANVHLDDPAHLEKLRRVFQTANLHRLPIAAHIPTQDLGYGRAHAQIYIDKIFPMAPDIPIQIAHLAGHGPDTGGEALAAFAEAAAAGDPRMKNIYFDVASNVQSFTSRAELALIAKRIRQIGLKRILFATDLPAGGPKFTIKEGWAQFRRLPLTEEEFAAIANNAAPYMR